MEEQNNALKECFARLASHIIIINMLQTVPCGVHIADLQLHCFFIVIFTIGHISNFSFILHLIPVLLCGQKGFGSSCYWAPALTTPSTLTTPPSPNPPLHTQHPISQFQVPHPLSLAKHPSRPNPRSHLIMQWNVRRRQHQRQRGALLVWHRPEGQEYVARHFSLQFICLSFALKHVHCSPWFVCPGEFPHGNNFQLNVVSRPHSGKMNNH